MNQITIRKAVLTDLETLKEFMQGVVIAELPYNPTLKKENVVYYDIAELISSPKSECLVAEVDGKIVGSGYAQIRKAADYFTYDEFSYLGFMYVLPDYRGRSIIQLVLDELIIWSKKQGISEFRLDVYSGNEGAIRAYEKAGFEKLIVKMRRRLEE